MKDVEVIKHGSCMDWYTNTKGYDADGVQVDPCIFGCKVAYIVKSCYVQHEMLNCHVTVTLQPLPNKEGVLVTPYIGVYQRKADIIDKNIDLGVQWIYITPCLRKDELYSPSEVRPNKDVYGSEASKMRDLSECGHVGLYGDRTYYYWTEKHEYPSDEAYGLFGQDAVFITVSDFKTNEVIHDVLRDINDKIIWLNDISKRDWSDCMDELYSYNNVVVEKMQARKRYLDSILHETKTL